MSNDGLITVKELATNHDITEAVVKALVKSGDLPPYTFGSAQANVKGWLIEVIRCWQLSRFKNICASYQVDTVDKMNIDFLGQTDRRVTEKLGNLIDRDPAYDKLRRKVMA